MRVFVAGASGAIGRPLVAEMVRRGHSVTAMARSDVGGGKLRDLGATVATADALDREAVEKVLRQSQPEIVIDQLTSLPLDPSEIAAAAPGDRELRLRGGGNLLHAARAGGVRRYIQQSSGFFLRPGLGLAGEAEGLATDAGGRLGENARIYAELEARVLGSDPIEGVALRYGFFYGPNTWYRPDGAAADQARRREIPIVGTGQGVWSFVHVEDAAIATVAALTAPPGIYHVVDDDPSPVARWLPAFASWVGAPPPACLTEAVAREVGGEDAVYYGTKLRGATNEKARTTLDFLPRRLQWLNP